MASLRGFERTFSPQHAATFKTPHVIPSFIPPTTYCGLGAQGLYNYYHTLSKTLSIAQINFIKTKDGKLIDWRADITQKLLNLQKGDGSRANSEGRWMESDPVLTTSYILMALGRIHPGYRS